MTCPACDHTFEPETTVVGLTICPHCLASLVVANGERATGKDTTGLAPESLTALKDLRATHRKAKEAAQSVAAVDPQVGSTGKPSPRDKDPKSTR